VSDEIIIDEFSLINHIAAGSSTQVWEVVDKAGGDRHFAMKLMLPEAFADSEQKAVLKHEAKLCQKFEHANLVRFHKLVVNKKRAYMVMEYFRAPNVKTQLQMDLVSVQVRLGRLLEQLCQVMGYLHDLGYVHRDIKPDNMLFNKGSELRLIDFSLTTRAAGAVTKMLGGKEKAIQGTRTYISPETILKAPPSPQADIYSLGVTVYEILAGEPPFVGSSPDDLLKKHLSTTPTAPSFFNDNITPEMDRFVLKLLAKRTKDRHKNMNEVLAEFRNLKPFKEDVLERDRRKKNEAEERNKTTLDKSGRLDSRADHLKQRLIKENPELAKEYAVQRKKAQADAEVAKALLAKALANKSSGPSGSNKAASPPAAPAAPAPMPAAPPPPMMPAAYPGPQYGYPVFAPPGYPMPGYPPAGYGGGYPQPPYPGGYPQQPPGAYPQQMPPGQMPYPPGQPPHVHPGNVPAAPYGAIPYGSQMNLPSGAPQPGVPPRQPMPMARPPVAGMPPQAPSHAIDDQQQLMNQLMGPTGAQPPTAARPAPVQTPPNRPAPRPTTDLPPLMDQLPPVK